jgi:hypothetical protein
MTTIRVDADLIRHWIRTLEFIQGCNGAAILDPLDVSEQLEAARNALGQKGAALNEELAAVREKPLAGRADIQRAFAWANIRRALKEQP